MRVYHTVANCKSLTPKADSRAGISYLKHSIGRQFKIQQSEISANKLTDDYLVQLLTMVLAKQF